MRSEGAWPAETELAAASLEELDLIMRISYAAASGKRLPGKNLQVPRPWDRAERERPRRRRQATPEELAAFLGVQRGDNRG
jgi:hypothetical protein